MQYSKIDLFTLLPAVFWDNLEPKCEAGDPLVLNIDAARTQDKVVSLDNGRTTWTRSNAPHTKTILAPWATRIKAFANVVVSIGNLLLSGVKALLQLSFAAFLCRAGHHRPATGYCPEQTEHARQPALRHCSEHAQVRQHFD